VRVGVPCHWEFAGGGGGEEEEEEEKEDDLILRTVQPLRAFTLTL
jgi:hypothetical protein